MLYLNQRDYPNIPYRTNTDDPTDEYGRNTTVSSSACGLCAAIMVADRLRIGHGFDLSEALKLSYETGANHRRGTHYQIFAPAFAEKLRLKLEASSDPERLRHCLRTGGAAVLHCCGDYEGYTAVFSHKGHFITAISETEDGRICVLDPSQTEGKYDEPGRRGKVEVDGHICMTTMDVVMEETENRVNRFYLFWRK